MFMTEPRFLPANLLKQRRIPLVSLHAAQPLARKSAALGLLCPMKMGRKTRNIMCNLNLAMIAKRFTLKNGQRRS
jgi:hypothetical protein